MSMDKETVRKVASLARLRVTEEELDKFAPQLSGILEWIEQLGELDTSNVEPLSNVVDIAPVSRQDEINDGNIQSAILANAPEAQSGYFTVPKIIEQADN